MRDCTYCKFPFVPLGASTKFCSLEHRDAFYKETKVYARNQRNFNNRRRVKPIAGGRKCAVCGLWFLAVCHHAWQVHGIHHVEYKQMEGLDISKGLIPKELKEIKKEHVFENGTVDNLKKGAKRRYVKGDKRAGNYERSKETMERLKNLPKLTKRAKV